MQDTRTNSHRFLFGWGRYAGRKPTEISATEFATQAWETQQKLKLLYSAFSNTVQIAKFHEIHHVLANITALSAAV